MNNIKDDRNKYIGGSDISTIMGLNPFKKRFDLLLEKAGFEENDFDGNEYTDYGNILEPKIRDYINKFGGALLDRYNPDTLIVGDLRGNFDGLGKISVLEIKTTSMNYDDIMSYKVYLVQLLFYMVISKKDFGLLAIYIRPENFNEDFDVDRLKYFIVKLEDYKDLVKEIFDEIEKFKDDLIKVKNNPLITEDELQPKDLVVLANKVVLLEEKLLDFKKIEVERDKLKAHLKEKMQIYGTKKWTTTNGTQITLVDDTPDSIVEIEVYDDNNFIKDNKQMVEEYNKIHDKYKKIEKQKKKGRAGYVKITLPKEKK